MLIGLLVLLLVPTHSALTDLGWVGLHAPHLVGSLALVVLLALLPSLMPRPLAGVLLALALALILIVRLGFFGIVQFSGGGFTNELFIHLEPKSFAIAWEQYRALCVMLLVALACIPFLATYLVRKLPRTRAGIALVLVVVAVVCIGAARKGLPEWMLASEIHAWYSPKQLGLPPAELQRWRDSDLVEVELPKKTSIRATAALPPRNLILIYLESMGQRVIEHPDYPGLMPNLARRLQAHALLHDYFAASYITIEGITNSQCGTLFPFERDSRSLAGFDSVAEEQACLGDVLHTAGYTQSYLGGAESNFAGKGHFLSTHGYDRVLGWNEWKDKGFKPRPGGWGLGDPDLFEQAWVELEALRASGQPFNLTLLTIGTHLPGFNYAECTPYGSDEPFIEAVHCTDQLLERFLERIEQAGYLDDSVVVVTGDHHVFPNPLMKKLFGTDAISDRRLPLLVLGKQTAPATAHAGASYDLAPTVLDLLGVDNDARFALGRSLLHASATRDYFVTRYDDTFAGEPVSAAAGGCDESPPQLPLRACDKDALKTLLRMQNAAFSVNMKVPLVCNDAIGTSIRIPDQPDAPLQFVINGHDQAARFTNRQARSELATQPGLFVAAFAPGGELLDRHFVSQKEASALAAPPVFEGANHYLVAWRSDDGTIPTWLLGLGPIQATAVLIDTHGELYPLPRHARDGATEFVLAPDVCSLWQDPTTPADALDQRLAAAITDARRATHESVFCPIEKWGPQQVYAGERFNPQPDGSSAFWLQTECAPKRVMLEFDGRLIETVLRLPIITAALNADRYLMQEGEWPLQLYDPSTRQRQPIGTLQVLPPRHPVALPEPPATTWAAVAPPIKPPVLIAHAGGGWQDRQDLNSLEALAHNYALGHRVFELDFSWTSDGQLVLIRDWESPWQKLFPQANPAQVPDHETFLRASMVDGQTQLDLPRLRDWLRAHPDAYVVTDIRSSNMLGLQRIAHELKGVQKQIIPQMYHAFRYPEIRALGYEQIIFTLRASSLDTDSLLAFIRATPLFAVTVEANRPDAERLLSQLKSSAIPIYVSTLNEPADLERFRALGAHGLYTDLLYLDKDGTPVRQ